MLTFTRPRVLFLLALLIALGPGASPVRSDFDVHDEKSPLRLVRIIELPDVKGRIDHMAFDPERNHLFVAEYGNGSVDDVDVASGKLVGRIRGLHAPQGVAWLPKQSEIAVASGDGLLTFFRSIDRREVAAIRFGNDADNAHVDSRNGDLMVGYGSGRLAIVDPSTHRAVRELSLPGHPEGFALLGSHVFVNVPDAHQIVVGDLDQARVITTLNTGNLNENYPMASNPSGSRVAVAFRSPGTLSILDARSGATTSSVSICGDADDLYFYAGRIAVVCGRGAVDGAVDLVGDAAGHGSVRVATQRGARTGLLVPKRNSLFVAVPAQGRLAAIWELSFR